MVYKLDTYYNTSSVIHKEQSDLISDGSLVSVKHIEEVGKKEQVYFAICNSTRFKVW